MVPQKPKTMSAKESILNRIKGAGLASVQLPELDIKKTDEENLLPMFIESLKTAGAEVFLLPEGADTLVYMIENYPDAIRFDSVENWQKYGPACSLSVLNLIKSVLITGILGVAENGAIWVNNTCFPHRIIPFITQHLILKVNVMDLVPTMHEAYQHISFDNVSYGFFIAGPSKTADIEQSLVIGAHGPKALTVIIEN
jgi:L-lactate dehydrogenase complex protein LldG